MNSDGSRTIALSNGVFATVDGSRVLIEQHFDNGIMREVSTTLNDLKEIIKAVQ